MNVIDALVVTLGLDNRQFVKGTKESLDASDDLRDSAVRNAKRQEEAQKKLGESIRSVRNETLGLVLALAGASSIKSFVQSIITGDAATGRLAGNLGVATEQLSAWEGAITRVGGKAGDVDSAFQAMVNIRENAQLTGDHSQYAVLNRLGVTDLKAGPEAAFMQIAKTAQTMSKPEFYNLASRLGFNDAFINVLEKGQGALGKMLDEQRKMGVTTDQDAQAAQKFQDALARVESIIRGAARPQIEALTGELDSLSTNGEGLREVFDGIGDVLAHIVKGLGEVGRAAIEVGRIWADEKQAWAALKRGDFAGANDWDNKALHTFLYGVDPKDGGGGSGFDPSAFPGMAAGQRGAGSGRGGGRGTYEQIVAGYVKNGIPEEIARGVAAWNMGESGGNTEAFNPKGGGQGAHGIGQWRGDRLRKLRALYGDHPTLEQQIAFAASELKGGDVGGAAVLRSGDRASALWNAISKFGRPDKPGSTVNARAEYARSARYLGTSPKLSGARGGSGGASGNTTVNVGPVTVHSNATNGHDLARDFQRSLERRNIAIQAQSGMTP